MKPSPYPLVHFEANLLRNIDCGRLSYSLTCPRPLFDFFFHCFIRNFCQNSELVVLKSTFLTRDNKKKERRIPS